MRKSASPVPTMIVPSPGSTLIELIAGLPVPRPVDGGGAATVGAVVGAGVAGVAAGGAGSLPHPASATAATSPSARSRRTVEPRAARGHLDRPEQVHEVARLGERRLRMPHRRVHRPAAIVVMAPGQGARRV